MRPAERKLVSVGLVTASALIEPVPVSSVCARSACGTGRVQVRSVPDARHGRQRESHGYRSMLPTTPPRSVAGVRSVHGQRCRLSGGLEAPIPRAVVVRAARRTDVPARWATLRAPCSKATPRHVAATPARDPRVGGATPSYGRTMRSRRIPRTVHLVARAGGANVAQWPFRCRGLHRDSVDRIDAEQSARITCCVSRAICRMTAGQFGNERLPGSSGGAVRGLRAIHAVARRIANRKVLDGSRFYAARWSVPRARSYSRCLTRNSPRSRAHDCTQIATASSKHRTRDRRPSVR